MSWTDTHSYELGYRAVVAESLKGTRMVPLTLILFVGLVVSVRNGRTSILGAVMAVSLGAIAPDGPVIRALVSAVETVAAAVSAAATGVTGVLS